MIITITPEGFATTAMLFLAISVGFALVAGFVYWTEKDDVDIIAPPPGYDTSEDHRWSMMLWSAAGTILTFAAVCGLITAALVRWGNW